MHGVDLGQVALQDAPGPHVYPGQLVNIFGPLVQVSVLDLIPALLNRKKEKLANNSQINHATAEREIAHLIDYTTSRIFFMYDFILTFS